jgi:spermidine synthase
MGKYKFKNRKFPIQFQKVVDWISDTKGVDVILSDSTLFMGHFTRRISIHHNYDLNNNGLYALLHECGHVLQPATNIGCNAYKNIDDTDHPKEFMMGQFLNELDAWNRGMEIAKKLKLKINEKQFEKEKSEALLTYFTTTPPTFSKL